MNRPSHRFVVCGATGRTGSATARELLGRGHRVATITRDPSRAAALEAQGIRAVQGSLEDSGTLTGVLRGADGLFALLPEDPFAPDFHGPRRVMTEAMASAVRKSGVPRVVLLSAVAAFLPDGNGPAKDLHRLENALGGTGTVLTTLRACWLQENIGAVIPPATAAGIYPNFMHSADAAFPTIATRDVGRFAADALDEQPREETIDLLGPAYTVRQMSQVLGKAMGKTLRVVDLPPPAHVPTLLQAGLSQAFARAVAELYSCFASGKIRPRGDRQLAGTTPLEDTVGTMLAAAR
jgi:uncharacterized protein YbjT (DUF2867 family)